MDALIPQWFTHALAAPSESHYVDIDGTPIHYLTWNAQDTHKPGLLFAHGFRAHARWWSFIAPFLLDRYRVAAMDFAGMGDSGARSEYTGEKYAADIVGVIEHAKFDRPVVVGHSFGGGRVLHACAHHAASIGRAIIVDTHLQLGDEPRLRPAELGPKRTYPTFEHARARFRLIPPDNRAAPYILDYVAEHSIKRVDDGWTWKFDEAQPRLPFVNVTRMLASIQLPVAFIYGDASAIVSHQHALDIVAAIPGCRGPIAIPESHHHVLLDQPLALVSALRALLY